jgi:anti-sigma factor RsiW
VKLGVKDIVCQQAVELMSDYLDGSLSRRQRRRLDRHLRGCDACTAYLEQMRATVAVTGTVGPDDLDPETLDGLVDLFRRYQADEP